MSNARDRLIWFLADPTLSEADLKSIRKLLTENHGDRIFAEARELRACVGRDASEPTKHRVRAESAEKTDDPLLEGVSRLLLRESSFSVRSALDRLGAELRYDGSFSQFLSLKNGIALLCEQFTPSEVLSAAQRIRNQAVHHSAELPNASWPLKGKENDSGN